MLGGGCGFRRRSARSLRLSVLGPERRRLPVRGLRCRRRIAQIDEIAFRYMCGMKHDRLQDRMMRDSLQFVGRCLEQRRWRTGGLRRGGRVAQVNEVAFVRVRGMKHDRLQDRMMCHRLQFGGRGFE